MLHLYPAAKCHNLGAKYHSWRKDTWGGVQLTNGRLTLRCSVEVSTGKPGVSAPAVVTGDEISRVNEDERALSLMSYVGRHIHWLCWLGLHQQWWELKYLAHIADSFFWTPKCGLLITELPLTPHSCSVHAGTVLIVLGTVQISYKNFFQAGAGSELRSSAAPQMAGSVYHTQILLG